MSLRIGVVNLANEGFVDWLLDCPDKGLFVSVKSEADRPPAKYLFDVGGLSERESMNPAVEASDGLFRRDTSPYRVNSRTPCQASSWNRLGVP